MPYGSEIVTAPISAVYNAGKWATDTTLNALTWGWWNGQAKTEETEATASKASVPDTKTFTAKKGTAKQEKPLIVSVLPENHTERYKSAFNPTAWLPYCDRTYVTDDTPVSRGYLGTAASYVTSAVTAPLSYLGSFMPQTVQDGCRWVIGGRPVSQFSKTKVAHGWKLPKAGEERNGLDGSESEPTQAKVEGTEPTATVVSFEEGGTVS